MDKDTFGEHEHCDNCGAMAVVYLTISTYTAQELVVIDKASEYTVADMREEEYCSHYASGDYCLICAQRIAQEVDPDGFDEAMVSPAPPWRRPAIPVADYVL